MVMRFSSSPFLDYSRVSRHYLTSPYGHTVFAQTGGIIINNLVILYPGKDESVQKICGRRIPCIRMDV